MAILLTNFQELAPPVRVEQDKALDWLVAAHLRAEAHASGASAIDESAARRMRKLLERYGACPARVGARASMLPDFALRDWERMRIFTLADSPQGKRAAARTRFYSEVVDDAFARFYCEEAELPDTILHVTCTGYAAPSGAQKLVARRNAGAATEVIHCYHMGCYAALPAVKLAGGLLAQGKARADLVHTELCSLHLDPTRREPEQLVMQSLFADGLIRYSAVSELEPLAASSALEVVAVREEIIPASADFMTWEVGDFGMRMTLAREVPARIAAALPDYLERLARAAGATIAELRKHAIFAIHPGGPRIIDELRELLDLREAQVEASNSVLREHGNMSSATLPHIWRRILADPHARDGTWIVALAFGPGLTLSGALLRKRGA